MVVNILKKLLLFKYIWLFWKLSEYILQWILGLRNQKMYLKISFELIYLKIFKLIYYQNSFVFKYIFRLDINNKALCSAIMPL